MAGVEGSAAMVEGSTIENAHRARLLVVRRAAVVAVAGSQVT